MQAQEALRWSLSVSVQILYVIELSSGTNKPNKLTFKKEVTKLLVNVTP